MNTNAYQLKNKLSNWFAELSRREQAIVVVGSVCLVIVLAYSLLIEPAITYIGEQNQKLESAYRELKALPNALTRYDRVRARRSEIEKLYKSIEMPEGAYSYLESLIREQAGIASAAFTIREGTPRKFGNTYEQVPYNIQYKISDYPRLIKFLKELIAGKRPFIINRVSINKGRLAEHLDIDLEVSSVRKIQ